jgi:hypothetical protein
MSAPTKTKRGSDMPPPCAVCGNKLISQPIGRRSDNKLYMTVFYCPECARKPPRFVKG